MVGDDLGNFKSVRERLEVAGEVKYSSRRISIEIRMQNFGAEAMFGRTVITIDIIYAKR